MSKRVLTVDDDPDISIFVKTVLEENEYTPLVARNGEEGLAMAREEAPDLIILDVLMPKQSGIRMYRELRSDESLKKIPVIILSGIAKRTFLRSQEALTEFGDQAIPEPNVYLEKPVEPLELAETVKKLIGS
jgi:twitching motility two-component system response regulator PilH